MPTASIEEYLECIFKLQETNKPVRSNRIAAALKISAPSVTEMIKKMEEMGLVIRDLKKSLLLTSLGEEKALSLIRKHRLAERFLVDFLDMPWDMVHKEACEFEHVLSGEVEERLNKFLGNPSTCPHGHPIPGNVSLDDRKLIKLSELKEHKEAIIELVSEENAEILRYIGSLNLKPKAKVLIEEKAPFDGPITLIVNSKEKIAIGPEIANLIYVNNGRTK